MADMANSMAYTECIHKYKLRWYPLNNEKFPTPKTLLSTKNAHCRNKMPEKFPGRMSMLGID